VSVRQNERLALIAAAFDAVQAARTTDEERKLAARFKAAKDLPCGAPRLDNAAEVARLSAEIDALWNSRVALRVAAREAIERLLEWNQLQALEQIDLRAMRAEALKRVSQELDRRLTVDELVDLLGRTDVPESIGGVERAA
jgi:hypothetical protein